MSTSDNNTHPSDNSLAVRLNKLGLSLSRYWLRFVLLMLALYIGMPFLAPVLMRAGAVEPAAAIYRIYSPLCHQFAFRSVFLFGEQTFYPRQDANVVGLRPLDDYAQEVQTALNRQFIPNEWTQNFQFAAKDFVGTPRMGYKVAICARDVAIYLALLGAGIVYAIPAVRRRLRPVPLWLYVLLGVVPIGIDGFSQLLGYAPFNLWPPRETTPFLRMLTGALFGLMNAWLAFPYIEDSAHASVVDFERKFEVRRLRDEA